MKKIILAIFVISMVAIMGVGLVACNNATPQGQLANILNPHKHESFVYQALNTRDNTTGVLTVDLREYEKNSNVSFGTRTLEKVKNGICIKSELKFDDTVYEMGCYYNLIGSGTASFMTPAFSFRTVTVDNVKTFDMQGHYDGSTFICDRSVGDQKYENSIKLSGTIFDNNQFQQVLRSVTTFSSGLSLSFNTPIANSQGLTSATLTASGSSATKIKDVPYVQDREELSEEGINCYAISISRTTEVAGLSQMLYFAVDNIKCYDWSIKNVLVKIVEPYTFEGERFEMQYKLVSVEV